MKAMEVRPGRRPEDVDPPLRLLNIAGERPLACTDAALNVWNARDGHFGSKVQQARRNVSSASRQGRLDAPQVRRISALLCQPMMLVARLNSSPDFSIECMMTASLRATATAARLKPILSRSFSPQARRSLSA